MLIVGDEKSIEEIKSYLKEKARDWYADGKKEFDADVKIFVLDEPEDFHLG